MHAFDIKSMFYFIENVEVKIKQRCPFANSKPTIAPCGL